MSRFASMAGEQVADLADRCAEAGRLSRGRALFRKGSVSDLSVIEGTIIASVRGSEGDEYETTIGTALAPPGVIRQIAQANDAENRRTIDELIGEGLDVCPREVDLAFACNCADWEEPCKHVVAVFLAFADRVDIDESELLCWRGIDLASSVVDESRAPTQSEAPRRSRVKVEPGSEPDSKLQSRSAGEPEPEFESQAESAPADEPVDRSAKLSELEALLGETVMRVPTTDAANLKPQPSALEPALAEFLGIDMTFDPVDVSGIVNPDPLFADVQLGPLADLGPELATALATISAKLEGVSPAGRSENT